ncbi:MULTISPECIES: DUF192 domain-containing protein [Croceitalea]|uniref:DUF192 domain-containing protein n=1 Tax=Croceitalea vernalis TaxID=3075599 RepID=A0ABU3BJE6_9FLAO|nr:MULTISPECIES: DUF192 domain-containing protein [unclassified Croceitalea]MDT0540435.1 DUF192 domain-containing protein [Croceitalea sp. P059]MDT0622271.1 DUF192 domain-containing protein [Croceitalea sp. P007]
MKLLSNSIICIVFTLVIFGCKENSKTEIKTSPVEFTKEGELQIFKSPTDSLLVQLDIEFAKTEYETQTGLMYRESMAEKQGMLFIFKEPAVHSFYMKNTQIPLDIIYIDENQNIASFQEHTEPFNESGLSSKVPIQYVLEINAGLSEKWLLEVGDRITYSEN